MLCNDSSSVQGHETCIKITSAYNRWEERNNVGKICILSIILYILLRITLLQPVNSMCRSMLVRRVGGSTTHSARLRTNSQRVYRPVTCSVAENVRGSDSELRMSRRMLNLVPGFVLGVSMVSGMQLAWPHPAPAIPLAPLGNVRRTGGEKLTGLSIDEVKVWLNS